MGAIARLRAMARLVLGRTRRVARVAPKFDRELFEEAVLYIAAATEDDPDFGRLKMAKTLFDADFTTYAEEGEPLTGAVYEHWEHGPYPRILKQVERSLRKQGHVWIKDPQGEGDTAKLYTRRPPTFRRLGPERQAFLDLKIKQWSGPPSYEVEDEFHRFPGWRFTQRNDEIPYWTVHISREGPNQDDLDAAGRLLRKHGWA